MRPKSGGNPAVHAGNKKSPAKLQTMVRQTDPSVTIPVSAE